MSNQKFNIEAVNVPAAELLALLHRATNTMEPQLQPDWLKDLLHPTNPSPNLERCGPLVSLLFYPKKG